MSIDLGTEFMKIGIVKPGVPMEIVLNKYFPNNYQKKLFSNLKKICFIEKAVVRHR